MTRRAHRWAVDAISEGVARIEEDGDRMIAVPVHLLPAGVREGQLLRVSSVAGEQPGSLIVTLTVDEKGTAAALAKSKDVTSRAMSASRKKDPGGDVAL